VLVFVPGKVVDSVHVSPVDIVRNGLSADFVPGVGTSLDLTIREEGLCNTASVLLRFGEERISLRLINLLSVRVDSRLRERVCGFIVGGIGLLGCRSFVVNLWCPSVLRSSERAVGLNTDVVNSSEDFGETLFSPVRTPRVTHEPVLLSVLNSISNDRDSVNQVLVASLVFVNTSSVLFERVGYCDSTSDRSTLVDLLHHVSLSLDVTVFFSAVDLVLIRNEASLAGVAVSAVLHS